MALDVAEAVAYLHGEAHILHSDIKWVGGAWCNGPQGGGAGKAGMSIAASAIQPLRQTCAVPFHWLAPTARSANVLLTQDWRAALTDLGVAQVMESTARTAAGGSNLYAGGCEEPAW